MADIELNDVIRVSAVMEFKSISRIVNTWTVKQTVGGDSNWAAYATYMAGYMDTIYAEIEDELSDEVLPVHLSMSNLTQDTVFGSFAWGTFAGGLAAFAPTTAQVACLAYARTTISRVQMRKYFGVFTEEHMVDGIWHSAVSSACQAALAYHAIEHVVGGGVSVTGVAYSKTLDRATEALSVTSTNVPVIQRRRREGRGA